jgi:hypothetical protein
MRRVQFAGVVLLVVAAAGALAAPRIALGSLLAAWWWALGIVLGCFVNAWMHTLTGGAWGIPVRGTAIALSRRVPWLLLGLVVVAATMTRLYPWAMQPANEWTKYIASPTFVGAWLSAKFFIARLVVYGIGWWWITRLASMRTKGRAAASMIAYAVLTTLASVDLLMSLMPGWYSTAFGLIVMSTQALSGAALVVLLAPGALPVSRDLGNLLLMWCMSWGYLAFMQFLIIWAENLPREIAWYVPRLQTGWEWLAIALVVVQLVVPFLALLFRSVKDRLPRLRVVALLLLAATALDSAWTVLPSIDPHDWNSWWIAPLAMLGIGLLMFGCLRPEREAQHA